MKRHEKLFKLIIDINKFLLKNIEVKFQSVYENKIKLIELKSDNYNKTEIAELQGILNDELDELAEFILSKTGGKQKLISHLHEDYFEIYTFLMPILEDKELGDFQTSGILEKEYWNKAWNVYRNLSKKDLSDAKEIKNDFDNTFQEAILKKIKNSIIDNNFYLFKIILKPNQILKKEDILNLLIYIAIRNKNGYTDFVERPDSYGCALLNPFNELTLFDFIQFFPSDKIDEVWSEIQGESLIREINEIKFDELKIFFPKTYKNFKLRKFI